MGAASKKRKLFGLRADMRAALRINGPTVLHALDAGVRAVLVDEHAVSLCFAAPVQVHRGVAAGTDAPRARPLAALGAGNGQHRMAVCCKIYHVPQTPPH
ncbi:hypothetical protein RD1_A0075 (plasmid) [Roseobacter denitrificans OCh 114]|uniref:Uncharacterized protein n=1 Tax=Roseobacter denitrificans (strain ATCC 33942 / OCh 114) TaxID=375451 RepID=Q07GM5_ROSDO|nr:hypothetical protein RD1_A0075 [Roseobacter denitrificans OCh 114]